MKKIIAFFKSFSLDNTVLLKEDIEENMYYFLVGPSQIKNIIIDNTLRDTNKLLNIKYGDLMKKKEKRKFIDEITLFVARICRNYNFLPTDKQYEAEFNHFIKSMIYKNK